MSIQILEFKVDVEDDSKVAVSIELRKSKFHNYRLIIWL